MGAQDRCDRLTFLVGCTRAERLPGCGFSGGDEQSCDAGVLSRLIGPPPGMQHER